MVASDRISIVDDDPVILEIQQDALKQINLEAQVFSDPYAAWEHVRKGGVRLLVTDWEMPGMTGMELLFKTRGLDFPPHVILLTGNGSVDRAVEAMTYGAFNFLEKPFDPARYLELVQAGLDGPERTESTLRKSGALTSTSEPVAASQQMRDVLELARAAACSESSALLLGETGTGKEVVASYIHTHSSRAKGPLVKLNCGALPEHLLESELFGHEKGAFTGADKRRIGRFEQADGGTLFLDEIGDLLPSLQVKLLRALQERVIERVGSSAPVPVNFRLICATHKDLASAVQQGTFREDLYYRIAVVPILLPALRERVDDIGPLARRFVNDFRKRLTTGPQTIADEAIETLCAYHWPGNIRQLRNAIEYALILCKGPTVLPEHWPPDVRGISLVSARPSGAVRQMQNPAQTPTAHGIAMPGAANQGLEVALQQVEAQVIRAALERHEWNIEAVMAELKISRSRLYERMKAYGIRRA